MEENYFKLLSCVNVNDHTEKKNGLTYLSWSYAIAEILKKYPTMTYTIWKDENNRPYIFDPALGYMVFTSVTIDGETKEMWLPVMDNANNAMKDVPYTKKTKYKEIEVAAATMFDINTAIMRCLVKNFAMFGLGLYIYAGEDLPEEDEEEKARREEEAKRPLDTIQIKTISGMMGSSNTEGTDILNYVNKTFGKDYKAIKDLTQIEYVEVIKILQKKIDKQKNGGKA